MEKETKRNATRERCRRVEVLLPPKVYEELKERARKDGLTMTVELKMAIRRLLGTESEW